MTPVPHPPAGGWLRGRRNSSENMRVLGIETSCDETAICLMEASGLPAKAGDIGKDFQCRILGNALHSQAVTHAFYGGVFPNLAKQMHAKNLVPLLEQTLKQSGQSTVDSGQRETKIEDSVNSKLLTVNLKNLLEREPELYEQLTIFLQKYARPEIDVIAVTVGPGLEPALWAGINLARALSRTWKLPIVPVNHMEGHIIVSLLRHDYNEQLTVSNERENSDRKLKERNSVNCNLSTVNFPALALLVSGGHTELVLMREWMKYEIIGETRDDAVGEAFDKVARMLGLPYPGGPHISRLAEEARTHEATPRGFALPRAMMHSGDLDFSFSGLKTAVKRMVDANRPLSQEMKLEIAREFEDAAVDVLVEKSRRAAEEFGAETLIVGGGVSANKHLRKELGKMAKESNIELFISLPKFTGDNAVMIALAGYFRAQYKEFADPDGMSANGNLRLG